jgi:uncharacterized membrane protein YqjE
MAFPMPAEETGTDAASPRGVFLSFKALLATLLDIVRTRLDLLFTELEEELERVKQIFLFAMISFFCLGLGVLFLTLFVVVMFWDTHRLYVVGGFAVLYLLLALLAGLSVRKKARSKPKFLSSSLSELAKDRERLRP